MMVGLSTVKRPKAVNPMGALLSWVRKVVIYTENQHVESFSHLYQSQRTFFRINSNSFKYFNSTCFVLFFLKSTICVNLEQNKMPI